MREGLEIFEKWTESLGRQSPSATSRLGNAAVCGYRAYQAVQTGDWLGLGFSALWFLKALRSACFVAGTQVLTGINADGTYQSRNIEDLKIGDLVLTRDQNDPDGKLELRPITNLYVHTVYDLRVLQLTSPDGNVETIRTTDEHPFYCLGKGWTGAGELRMGDQVLQEDGSYATVTSSVFESHPEGLSVYNFAVEGDHTYFVEDGQGDKSPVWVHNLCGSWSKARSDYWKNVALGEQFRISGLYSQNNIDRMAKGLAPRFKVLVMDRHGQVVTQIISMELHHDVGRRTGLWFVDHPWNLAPVTPWQHELLDKCRFVGSTLVQITVGLDKF